jgi:hypothetical protein
MQGLKEWDEFMYTSMKTAVRHSSKPKDKHRREGSLCVRMHTSVHGDGYIHMFKLMPVFFLLEQISGNG